MMPTAPFNAWLMYMPDFIQKNMLQEVTSQLLYEPSSTNFHPEGLFSESIFGQIGSSIRYSRLGYITLHTKLINPTIFDNIINLKRGYLAIMESKDYAIWNKETKMFDIVPKETEGSQTGYNFFISHLEELQFAESTSVTKKNTINTFYKAIKEKTALVEYLPVLPAGIRDIKEKNGRIDYGDINPLYITVLALSQEIKNAATNPFLMKYYDGIKYNLQLKINEIYRYLKNFVSGKGGFAQQKYARRAIAWGTRNVAISPIIEGISPSDDLFFKNDEIIVPVFQAAKGLLPLVSYHVRKLFYEQLFSISTNKVPAIDPRTYKVEYIEISDSELSKFTSTDAIETLVNSFQNIHMRDRPITVESKEGKRYFLYLVYDLGDEIYMLRNVEDFRAFMLKNRLNTANEKDIDKDKLRPLTYIEMLYIAVFYASKGKYATITRYPAIEIGSIYPAKVKIASTVPSRKVYFMSQYAQNDYEVLLSYPILGNTYQDGMQVHPSQNKGLGLDYDKLSHCRSKIEVLSWKV